MPVMPANAGISGRRTRHERIALNGCLLLPPLETPAFAGVTELGGFLPLPSRLREGEQVRFWSLAVKARRAIVEARPLHRGLLPVRGSSGRIGARFWRSGFGDRAMLVVLILLAAVGAMIALSVRADRRFRAIDRLPMQWTLTGTVSWHAPRTVALAFTPVLGTVLILVIGAMAFLGAAARRAGGAGDPGAAGHRGGHGGDPCAAYLDDRALGEGAALNRHWG